MKITNVNSNQDYSKEVVKTVSGRIRKKLAVMDVSGKTWNDKRKDVKKVLMKVYKDIPDGINFARRKTKDLNNNPDGLRLFVLCSWINRNRFYDEKGIFNIGSLLQAINRQIDGKTKKNILIKEKQK